MNGWMKKRQQEKVSGKKKKEIRVRCDVKNQHKRRFQSVESVAMYV